MRPPSDPTTTDRSASEGAAPATMTARHAAHVRAIVDASAGVDEAHGRLVAAVAEAREAGESWTAIGAALGTSRQNAQQRFGRGEA
ncbi:hypothetical protein QQX09_08140 [Demequina sp. SYSU T00192]|uniref:Helix-turn-helix domain-containing protein n=1 Tax=Demequina litoralis TaxID=3051660 RepID=A0ABT8G9K9_9MICO|nr:hypothetical protein [Demequina sp. SYSU T00192]MDN4475825.1 hypothetical protein [Demequina sp. SYSU T00192]